MKGILNFEEIADEYSRKINNTNPKLSKIARCDYLNIKDNEILFIEETELHRKNLLNPHKYQKEITENIKKMWGSLTIFALYVMEKEILNDISGKDRIYILLLDKKDNKLYRIIGNILKALKKHRDSGFSDVKYKFKEGEL